MAEDPSPTLQKEAAEALAQYTSEMVRCNTLLKLQAIDGFDRQPTDVYITSFLKSGTTLTQQLLYQLLVAIGNVPSDPTGDNFDNITRVVPTIEHRHTLNVHDSVHPHSPRLWKSHGTVAEFDFVPLADGKFVYCLRNGLDVARSYLDFTLDWVLYQNPVKGQELRAELYRQWFLYFFLALQRLPDGTFQRDSDTVGVWFSHLNGWINVDRPNVFYLIYEDVTRDMPTAVRQLAKFLELDVSTEVVDRVVKKCDRAAMANDARFMDSLVSDATGLDSQGGIRVRPTSAPGFKDVQLPDSCIDVYNEIFFKTFGVRTYEELLTQVRAKNVRFK